MELGLMAERSAIMAVTTVVLTWQAATSVFYDLLLRLTTCQMCLPCRQQPLSFRVAPGVGRFVMRRRIAAKQRWDRCRGNSWPRQQPVRMRRMSVVTINGVALFTEGRSSILLTRHPQRIGNALGWRQVR
jgi:hypothetical protein